MSEDSPLVSVNGEIYPFPLCLGCKGPPPENVPEKYVRRVSRMEFDPKTLIDLDFFESKLVVEPLPPGPILFRVRHGR